MLKSNKRIILISIVTLFLSNLLTAQTKNKICSSEYINFNNNWYFSETDSYDYSLTTFKPDQAGWKKLDLPHGWSIKQDFDKKLEACTAFMPGGIGWYSKYFKTTINDDQHCFIVFDGVYNNAEFWINGMKIGEHPFGYSPIYYDLSNYLKPKGEINRISVRVNHSRYADSRWYSGSGIYRNVDLYITDNVYIPVWGTYITTPIVSKKLSKVNIKTSINCNGHDAISYGRGSNIQNATIKPEETHMIKGVVTTDIYNAKGKKIASSSKNFEIADSTINNSICVSQDIDIKNVKLWDCEHPYLYTANTYLTINGYKQKDHRKNFGFRTIRFDKDKGFFLNDKFTRIKGVCLHHDAGLVGAAVPKDVWKRRLKLLKDAGCNAIRTSHNPVSYEFLDLCDQMGFLVQEEFYDEWDLPKDKRYNMQDKEVDYITRGHSEHFQKWSERDLKNTMLRDRSHPCIFQWSIGNEIEWEYPGNRLATGIFTEKDLKGKMDWTLWRGTVPPNTPSEVRAFWKDYLKKHPQKYLIEETANKLAGWTREMDITRPVTANCILPTSSFETGYTDVLDVVGFSYKAQKYPYFKKTYPNKTMMGTENVCRWYEWKAVLDHKFIAGIFLWTGIDYLGECRTKDWPRKATANALLDVAGFPRGSYYQFKSLWSNEASIAIYTQTETKSIFKNDGDGHAVYKKKDYWKLAPRPWQNVNPYWNYTKETKTIVEIYSNCQEIELFLNGKSQGIQYLKDQPDHVYKWPVKYMPGKLVAKGVYNGKKVTQSLETTGPAVAIKLIADRHRMSANNTDVTHVVAKLIDAEGREVKNYDTNITFEIDGEYRFLGTDCGDSRKMKNFTSRICPTAFGKCLLEIQATHKDGVCNISASSENGQLKSKPITIKIEK